MTSVFAYYENSAFPLNVVDVRLRRGARLGGRLGPVHGGVYCVLGSDGKDARKGYKKR